MMRDFLSCTTPIDRYPVKFYFYSRQNVPSHLCKEQGQKQSNQLNSSIIYANIMFVNKSIKV